MTKVSIIVPVYNVEKYLDKCLKSLTHQTLDDIEIIVVNDGSSDNSQRIIDKYAKKYSNIKAYKKKNGGLSSARNCGLKHAKGEYIGFVDGDDYIEPDMYEKMYKKAIYNALDVVVCNIKYIYNYKTVNVTSKVDRDLITTDQIKRSMNYIYPAVWNKIYHRRLLKYGVKFKDKALYEDIEWFYRLYPYIKSIGQIDSYGYNYVQRPGAISKTFNEKLFDYISNWSGVIDYYKEKNFYNKYKNELEYSYIRYIYGTFIKNIAKARDKDMFNCAVKEAIENVKNRFPNYRKNKYFYLSGIKGLYLLVFNRKIASLIYFMNFR